jgi:predicted metal-binding protein
LAEALHLQRLISLARELGAERAAPVPARAIVVDERVRLKCRVPLCSHWGRNLMCPPHVPGPDETRATLKRYSDALVVQQPIPLTAAAVEQAYGDAAYAEVRAGDVIFGGDGEGEAADARPVAVAECDAVIHDSQNSFARVMTALEAEAFKMGYRFAAAFAGGDCVLCEVCEGVDDGVCRHPFEARPSMEAVGIDVVATAQAAGLTVELPAADEPCWTGLLLID